MVKHVPKALLLALLVGTPVIAVDYVKCEAMQRAYGRLVTQRDKDWGNAKAWKIMKVCPTSKPPFYPSPNVNNEQEMDSYMAHIAERGRQIKAEQACTRESGNIAMAEAVANKEVLFLGKKIAKVKADYFAAKCP
jgi:hypothetical protein